MSRNKGTFNFAANFEPLVKAPLDGRIVVSTKADLINPVTWQDAGLNVWLFKGIVVSVVSDPVSDNNGLYFLTDETNYTNYAYWIKIAGITPSSSILTFDGSITGNNITTSFAIVHDLSTMKQNVDVWDASTNEVVYPAIMKGSSTNYVSFYTPPSSGTVYNITIMGF